MEEVIGKLDDFKVHIRKEIGEEMKKEMKLKVMEIEADLKEEMKLKIKDLTAKMTTLECSLPSIVSATLRDIPYLMFAAYQVSWWHFLTLVALFQDSWASVGTVNYDYFIADYNNGYRPNGGNGTMDLDTGVFR